MKRNLTVPHPENPNHVENLKTIELLEAQGFEGLDASLSESIFEYGMAWRTIENEIIFVHRNPNCPGRFDRSSYQITTDVQKEWNWVKWDALMGYLGCNLTDWLQTPLPHKIFDLVNYYGEMEIFGESGWEGFSIEE